MFVHPMWVEKYRPTTIEECILPQDIEKKFLSIVKDGENGEIPNMAFYGSCGIGKTTVALALAKQMGRTHLLINASRDSNIDTVRTTIQNFASTMSLDGSRKVIILDEADNMNINSMQPALRAVIEECSMNCSFIMTLNFKSKIIDALFSRCPVTEFVIPKNERNDIAVKQVRRCIKILQAEGITFDAKAVAAVVKRHFPDLRSAIGVLQEYAKSGSIDSGILASLKDAEVETLVKSLKNKDFAAAKAWVDENDGDQTVFFNKIYQTLYTYIKPESIPAAVLVLAKYQYQAAHVANQSINTLAFCTELMSDVEFA